MLVNLRINNDRRTDESAPSFGEQVCQQIHDTFARRFALAHARKTCDGDICFGSETKGFFCCNSGPSPGWTVIPGQKWLSMSHATQFIVNIWLLEVLMKAATLFKKVHHFAACDSNVLPVAPV